jgi:hypothetical protein
MESEDLRTAARKAEHIWGFAEKMPLPGNITWENKNWV